jgi:hypothetical protein
MAATLDDQGFWYPPFFIKSQYANASYTSGRRPPLGQKPIKGMTVPKMKEWIDMIDDYVDEPSILLLDRLGAHKSAEVISYIESKTCSDGRKKFKVKLFPAKSAFLISPLDFGFFGYWKPMYYKMDRSTTEMKFAAARKVWKDVEPEAIKRFFAACHFTGTESKQALRDNLMSHVRAGMPESLEEVWDFYDGWKSGAFDVEGVSAPRDVPLEAPTLPLDSDLNGLYWINWGSHGHKP